VVGVETILWRWRLVVELRSWWFRSRSSTTSWSPRCVPGWWQRGGLRLHKTKKILLHSNATAVAAFCGHRFGRSRAVVQRDEAQATIAICLVGLSQDLVIQQSIYVVRYR